MSTLDEMGQEETPKTKARATRKSPGKHEQTAKATPNEIGRSKPRKMSAGDMRQYGLCSTCNSIETCINRKNWKGPVMFCEEFDDCGPVVTTGGATESAKKGTAIALPEKTNAPSVRRGLCVNCLHCETCGFPIVEGGVWHCEKYE